MIDKRELDQLFAQYGWPMDSREWPVLETVFTADATFTIAITGGDTIGPIEGRDAIVDFCSTTVNAQTDQRRHVITNVRVEREEGGVAVATAILTLVVVENGRLEVKSSGLYRTEVVEDAGALRFRSMHLTLDLPF